MRKIFDALLDVITIAVLVFTVMATVDDVVMRYILAVVGCGAMFNNFKYIYKVNKKIQKDKDKDKDNKNEPK